METILFVDDEPNVLKGVRRQFEEQFEVETAESPEEGLEILTQHQECAVVISDFRMPGMNGAEFLARVREQFPSPVRMLLTGFADMEIALEAVNRGHIFRMLTKPCSPEILKEALQGALEYYHLMKSEKILLENTLTGSLKTLADILGLVNPEAFGRASRLHECVKLMAVHLGLSDGWRLELAAKLSQIGCVVVPDAILKKLQEGQPLSLEETKVYSQHPETGGTLLSNIPRLEEIANIIRYQQKNYDGTGVPRDAVAGEDIPIGARLMKVALDFDTWRLRGCNEGKAYQQLAAQQAWYDPHVLEALRETCSSPGRTTIQECSLIELRAGMTLAAGIYHKNGTLLVSEGTEISDYLINRLGNMGRNRISDDPIKVCIAL